MSSFVSRWWLVLRTLLAAAVLLIGSDALAITAEMRAAAPSDPSDWEPPMLPVGWTRMERPAFEIAGPEKDIDLLERLSEHGERSLPQLAHALGVPIGTTIHVYVADEEHTFRALQPGPVPGWADGTAWPGAGVIFLHHPDLRPGHARPLEQVLDHELVHILLGRALAPAPVPHWLQEGAAQVLSGEAGPDLPDRIRRGIDRAPTLAELSRSFPSDAAQADVAYAMSADVVIWMQAEHGRSALKRLVAEAARGQDMVGALRDITGLGPDELEKAWRSRWTSWLPSWLFSSQLMDTLWVAASVAALLFGAARWTGRKRKLSTWRDEHQALDRLSHAVVVHRHQARRLSRAG
jgi:hypothetical protein